MQKKQTLRPSPTALLNPRLDPNFKAIFTQETKGSDIALQSFLSSVLGREIANISLTSNEPPVDTPDQMQMSFDVSVTFEDGEKASIEMQGRNEEYDYAVRSEIQAARLLNNNAKKGCDWDAEKVFQISVLNFHLPKDDKCELSWYTMKDKKGHELSGHLNVIYVDLLEIKELLNTPVEQLTSLQKWGLYLSYADDERQSDYISQIVKSEKGIMEANRIIKRMSEEDENWFREFSYDKARRDYNARMKIATQKGLEQGIQQGIQQGLEQGLAQGVKQGLEQGIQQGSEQKALEDAKNFLHEGISPEVIARCVGLPIEKIMELQSQNNEIQ